MGMFEDWLLLLLNWGTIGFGSWALLDSVIRPTASFAMAEKLTKPAWMIINALATAALFFFGVFSIFSIVGLVAIGVYLTDVRPAVRSIGRGDNRW